MSITGNLRTMAFGDLLNWLAASGHSGTLVFTGQRVTKKVFLHEGSVVAAASDNPREMLGYYLVGWGFLEEQELREAIEEQRKTRTMLGEVLVRKGLITHEVLEYLIRIKVEETIFDLMLWEEGEFRFFAGELPKGAASGVHIPAEHLIFEGARRKDERQRAQEAIPDTRHVPVCQPGRLPVAEGEDEQNIVAAIDGVRSIEEIALACRLPEFAVLRFVYRGLCDDVLALAPPSSTRTPTPGLSLLPWQELSDEIADRLQKGRLLEALRLHSTLLEKFGSVSEVVDLATRIEEQIEGKLAESPLQPDVALEPAVDLRELMNLNCDPAEGFVLSRVNGHYTVQEILSQLPGPPLLSRVLIYNLLERGLVRVRLLTGVKRYQPSTETKKQDEEEISRALRVDT